MSLERDKESKSRELHVSVATATVVVTLPELFSSETFKT